MKHDNEDEKHLRELVCTVDFYLTMKDGESERQALSRLERILEVCNNADSAFDITEHKVEKVY